MASSSQIHAGKAFGRNSFGRRARRVLLHLVVLIGAPAFILTSCPAYRDGVAGQLAAATEQTQSAARSGALALQLWIDGRSTQSLARVQVADARNGVVQAYQGIAVLQAADPDDLARQRSLAAAMTGVVGELGAALGAITAVPGSPAPDVIRQRLLDAADRLDRGSRS